MKHLIWLIIIFSSLFSCKKNPYNLQRIEGKQIPVNTEISSNAEIDNLVAPFKAKLESDMNKVLAYAPEDMYKGKGKSETNIGNFMADLCYKRGNPIFKKLSAKDIDFVLLNFGGIRAGISKGDVIVKNAFEVMPFENSMVVAELSYSKIQELLAYLAKSGKAHPNSKQLHLVIKDEKITSALLKGKELDPKRSYFVLTSDYLQHGGDRMFFFKDPVSLVNLNYKIRTAIIDELTAIDTISTKEDGRIVRK